MWIQFCDMHSGGGCKEPPYETIYIEAGDEEQAKVIFYNRFGHSPERVTCTCCGRDYSISSHQSLAQLTGFYRNCRSLKTPRHPETGLYMNNLPEIKNHLYLEKDENPPSGFEIEIEWNINQKGYQTLEQYRQNKDVLIIESKDIKPEEKIGELPQQGYVWID